MKIIILFLSLFFSSLLFAQHDIELSHELEKFQKENADLLKLVEKNKENPFAVIQSVVAQNKAPLIGGNGAEGLLKGALIPFRMMSEAELKTHLLTQTKGTFISDLFVSSPKFLLLVTRLLRHETALPYLGKIFADRNRLLIFIGVNILIVIVAWIIKGFQYKKPRGFFESIQLWFWRFTFVNTARIIVLIYFFHFELAPGWSVLTSTVL